MRWEVVERWEGFKVQRVPATDKRQTDMFVASFAIKHLPNTRFVPTVEQARQEGQEVLHRWLQAHNQQEASGGCVSTEAATPPHATPTGSLDPALGPQIKQQRTNQQCASPHPQPRNPYHLSHSVLQRMMPFSRQYSKGMQAEMQRLEALASPVESELAPAPAPTAHYCNGPCSGTLLQLSGPPNAALPGTHVLLGSCIGSGGFGSVYQGIVVSCIGSASSASSRPHIIDTRDLQAAMQSTSVSEPGAAEARLQQLASAVPAEQSCLTATRTPSDWEPLATTTADLASSGAAACGVGQQQALLQVSDRHVAVKVFHATPLAAIGADRAQLMASRELHALRLLRGQQHVVQLLGEGALLCEQQAEPGSSSEQQHSGGSSPQQVLRCAVLELLPGTIADSMKKLGCCSEGDAAVLSQQLLQLLVTMQSGVLGSKVIVHRDLKPSNILLRPGGASIAVADFGACSIHSAPQPVSLTSQDVGQQHHSAVQPSVSAAAAQMMHTSICTPYYASPAMYPVAARPLPPPQPAAAAAPPPPPQSQSAAALSQSQPPTAAPADGTSLQAASYDASVDVFAVGIIVLELLVGPVGTIEAQAPMSVEQAERWQHKVAAMVSKQEPLPNGVQLSDAALDFIGCCCGVKHMKAAAPPEACSSCMSPSLLLSHPWLIGAL